MGGGSVSGGIPKYAPHRDKYEPEIVRAFRLGGATVQYLSIRDAPDLLVGHLGVNRLIECKTDNAMPTPDQQEWHDTWRGEKPIVVRNAAQARKWLRMWTLAFADQARRSA
jgi:hypothetical protein